jgi:hypothetical protein
MRTLYVLSVAGIIVFALLSSVSPIWAIPLWICIACFGAFALTCIVRGARQS